LSEIETAELSTN